MLSNKATSLNGKVLIVKNKKHTEPTIEELLERKSNGYSPESQEYSHTDPSR
jgi:hypothetical protein